MYLVSFSLLRLVKIPILDYVYAVSPRNAGDTAATGECLVSGSWNLNWSRFSSERIFGNGAKFPLPDAGIHVCLTAPSCRILFWGEGQPILLQVNFVFTGFRIGFTFQVKIP